MTTNEDFRTSQSRVREAYATRPDDAQKRCQSIFKQMEADFGDIEMQLTANRGVVLEEPISIS